ncbi:MAG: fatty acid desaturase family protein [Bacteroidia bacterium]|jgi:linoleoyl-CoA desaturase
MNKIIRMTKVSFARTQDEFSVVLRKKVDEYFRTNRISQQGNWKLYSKTIILLSSMIALYVILVFNTPAAWIALPLCALAGINFAAIGFNVMHDGCHGSYSRKQWVNDLMGYSLDLMGGCSYFWKVKHNVAHHSYTNIEGHDEDIDIRPFMRMNTQQTKKPYHKYQHYYWPLLYSLTYFWWVFVRDGKKYREMRVATTEIPEMNFKEHAIFWGGKILYFALYWILPPYVGVTTGNFTIGEFILGYGLTLATTGITLGVVFQLAHTTENLEFPEPDPATLKIENAWFVHQLQTTANFATKSKVLGWFTGGLNFQVEHHLFPRMSHIHYPEVSKIVKQVCADYNIVYNEQPTFLAGLRSHIRHLKAIGAAA